MQPRLFKTLKGAHMGRPGHDASQLECNVHRLEELRSHLRHDRRLAEQLEQSITTLRRLLRTERRLLGESHSPWRDAE